MKTAVVTLLAIAMALLSTGASLAAQQVAAPGALPDTAQLGTPSSGLTLRLTDETYTMENTVRPVEGWTGTAGAKSERPRWLVPAIGAIVGGAVGGAWGYYSMYAADDYVAPPAYFVTIPLGAVAGALVGLIVDAAIPR